MVLTMVLLALLAPVLAPHDPTRPFREGLDALGSPRPPGGAFPLGTDSRGRDLLSRVLFGARISLVIGVAATGIAIAAGTVVGVTAGFFGTRADFALMRFTDVVMAFPVLMLAIALASVLGPSLRNVLLVVGLVSWTGVARVVRSETLALREQLYVEAARALGAPVPRLLLRHILPHLIPTLLVLASLSTATTILLDAGLSYVGLGVPPPAPSWGAMLTDGQVYYRTAPWLMLCPGLAIVWTVAGFNLLGFGARHALDPRRGSRHSGNDTGADVHRRDTETPKKDGVGRDAMESGRGINPVAEGRMKSAQRLSALHGTRGAGLPPGGGYATPPCSVTFPPGASAHQRRAGARRHGGSLRIRRSVALSTLLLTLSVFAAGCGRSAENAPPSPAPSPGENGGSAGTTEGKRGGTLKLAIEDDVPTLDPGLAYDTFSTALVHALYRGLVDYDAGTTVVPALASEWKIADNGKSYTFTLRPGLKYSDGSPVKAGDFKYAIERVLNPKTKSRGGEFFRAVAGAVAFRAGKAAEITGIRATDDSTLVFQLAQANPLFLNELALTFATPVPRAAVEKWGADFRSHPVGTGPFMLKEWASGQRLELVRNPNYYRPERPFVDTVELRVGLTQEAQMRLFENANLDVLPDIPSADYPRLKQDPKWSQLIDEAPVLTTWYLGMNTELAPFTDKRVRLAVNYAVDRDRLVQLRNGRAVKATSILPPKLPGFNPELKGWPHDPEKARALLKEAGHANGFATTLWIISSDQNLKLAEGIQSDLKEVGIQATLKPATLQSFLQATKTRRTTPFFHNGWFPDYPDPSSFLEPLFHSRQIAPVSSNNSTFYRNSAVDKLLDEGAALPLGSERLKKYQEAERLILEDAPWAPLYYEVETRIHQAGVHGVTIHPLWKYLLMDEIWKD